MKKTILSLVLVVIAFVIIFLGIEVRTQIRRTRTFDRMGQISVAIDKTLGLPPLGNYSPEAEALKRFPDLPNANGLILDGWGNPIEVVIKRLDGRYDLAMLSFGPDGKRGTADDLILHEFVEDTMPTSNKNRTSSTNQNDGTMP